MKITLNIRKLAVSSLYGLAAIGAVIGTTYAASTGALTGVDLYLTAIGTATWGAAAIQGFYLKCKARKIEVDLEAGIIPTNDVNNIKPSTHGKINASCHIASSTCFLISDVRHIPTTSSSILIIRSLGSLLWLKSAALCYLQAQQQGNKERGLVKDINVCGMKFSTSTLLIEAEYLASAALYMIAIYSDSTLNLFKVPGNIFWMLSAIHDTGTAIYDRYTEKSNTSVLQIEIPTPPVLMKNQLTQK